MDEKNPTLASDIQISDLLFEYLRIILYSPHKQALTLETLPDEFQKLGMGMHFLHKCVAEMRTFANDLSKGKLNTQQPNVENGLAAPLMSIHGALTHLTWLAQQVANGDYDQSIDFMGEFGQYFNTMITQLKERHLSLIEERQLVIAKEKALEQTQEMLMDIIMKVPQGVIVLNPETGERFFINRTASRFIKTNPEAVKEMQAALMKHALNVSQHNVKWELTIQFKKHDEEASKRMYFSVYSYYVPWQGIYAISHIITDKTMEKEAELVMHELSFKDELTGVYNRRYGMEKIQKWITNQREFCIAFIDIDYLKLMNDTYGHKEGDIYILHVVDILLQIPEEKVVCRMGGDEFMLLKDGISVEELETMLDKLRDTLVSYRDKDRPESRRSFSYGVSVVEKGFSRTISDVLHEADYKMYQYKLKHKASRA
ncbi:MAG: diguanylate cyclase [Leptospirales bacterium]|nr:diguanylate cyclase [Leptospirales bacterium]